MSILSTPIIIATLMSIQRQKLSFVYKFILIFKCYFPKHQNLWNIQRATVMYSLLSRVDRNTADKVSCSRTQHIDTVEDGTQIFGLKKQCSILRPSG